MALCNASSDIWIPRHFRWSVNSTEHHKGRKINGSYYVPKASILSRMQQLLIRVSPFRKKCLENLQNLIPTAYGYSESIKVKFDPTRPGREVLSGMASKFTVPEVENPRSLNVPHMGINELGLASWAQNWQKRRNQTKIDELLLHKQLGIFGISKITLGSIIKFVDFGPISTFLPVWESRRQAESIDTHIDHVWRPRIFGLYFTEAKTLRPRLWGQDFEAIPQGTARSDRVKFDFFGHHISICSWEKFL